MHWLWPALLLVLVILLARDDIARIASGLLYLSSIQGETAALQNPRSMDLLEAACSSYFVDDQEAPAVYA